MAESVAEFFLKNFHRHRHECACRQQRGYRTESLTYGEVQEMAFGCARQLEARGIAKGDRVMLWGENCAEWVAVFFACVLRGVIVVPMDDGSAGDFAMRVFQQVSAKLLLASRRHLHQCAAAQPAIETLTLEELAQTADPQSAAPPKVALSGDDILQIVFTSVPRPSPRA